MLGEAGLRTAEEPFLERSKAPDAPPRNSVRDSVGALVKSVVGTGIFALPPAVRASGLVLGSALVLLMAAISVFTLRATIYAVRALRRRGMGGSDGRIEFQQMTSAAYPSAATSITLLCVAGQLGSVLSYYALVAGTLAPLVPGLRYTHVVIAMTALVAPLSLLRTTSHPAFSLAMSSGNVACLLTIATVVGVGAIALWADYESGEIEDLELVDTRGVGLMFGVALHMFACHMEVVSIEQDMADRSRFEHMLDRTFACLTAVFLAFGVFVYICFGEATGREWDDAAHTWVESTILHNLPTGVFVATVELAMSANLVFMTPITLLPASKALEELAGVTSDRAQAALRLTIVFAVAVGAVCLPDFELITGVTGALSSISCFVMPALCYLMFCRDEMGRPEVAVARAVAAFGWVVTVWSLFQILTPGASDLSPPETID